MEQCFIEDSLELFRRNFPNEWKGGEKAICDIWKMMEDSHMDVFCALYAFMVISCVIGDYLGDQNDISSFMTENFGLIKKFKVKTYAR